MQGFRLAIEWGNPYKDPPEGKPHVLAEKYVLTDKGCPEIPEEFNGLASLGSGYNFTIRHIEEPPKQLSKETLSKIRKNRLQKRIEKKYPLFADQIIESEMNSNPEYFEGITRSDLQEKKNGEIERSNIEYKKLLELGEVINDH